MADRTQGLPKFWATGIAKILVGEQPCELATWLPSHFDIAKRKDEDDSALVAWRIKHTELLKKHAESMRDAGWKTQLEHFWRVKGNSAILSGKADIVAQKKDFRPLIVDTKSGGPRGSDVAQVLLYMVMLPIAWESPSMIFDGKVVYETHEVNVTPRQAEEFKPKLFAAMKRLASDVRPEAHPEEQTCRWCSVSKADCPSRIDSKTEDAKTELF